MAKDNFPTQKKKNLLWAKGIMYDSIVEGKDHHLLTEGVPNPWFTVVKYSIHLYDPGTRLTFIIHWFSSV